LAKVCSHDKGCELQLCLEICDLHISIVKNVKMNISVNFCCGSSVFLCDGLSKIKGHILLHLYKLLKGNYSLVN